MATRQNLLSPEELSALSEGLKDGTMESDTGFNTGVRVRKHDLASENSSLGVNVSSIDMINERFIRMFRLGLLEVLRTTPRVNPTRVQIMKFGDYVGMLKPPLSVNTIRINPMRGNSVIMIDPNVVFSSLDSFFGGFGKGVSDLPPGRLFTATETRIIHIILEVFFRSLKEAWGPVLEIDCERVSSEINPQFAQIADENDLVILSRFETETATQIVGFFDVVHPYTSLKPVRELLRSRVQSGDGNEDSDRQWRGELEEAVGGSCMEARVVLGYINSTLRVVESMQAGDILYFKKPEFAVLEANEIPAFDVHVGTLGAQVAVQVERAVIPGKS